MRINKSHIKALNEMIAKADENGCVGVDEWTSGKGRFTSRRALPPFCREYTREALPGSPREGTPERHTHDYFRKHGRRRKVIVVDYGLMLDALHGSEF